MLIEKTYGALQCYQHPDWDIPHGFFTRKGGNSQGLYQGLNTGVGSQDVRTDILNNQSLIAKALLGDAYDETALYLLYQYHSAQVIETPFADHETYQPDGRIKGDAMVNNRHQNYQSNGLMGIMTADCVPVLFYDRVNHIRAAAHAGWKGAFTNILKNTIHFMQIKGADINHIQAAIGPSIAQKSYQVGAEFYQNFLEKSENYQQFFMADITHDKKYLFDLVGFVAYLLQQAGIKQIAISNHDTCAEEDLFFSYRRSCLRHEADYGRNLSVIGC